MFLEYFLVSASFSSEVLSSSFMSQSASLHAVPARKPERAHAVDFPTPCWQSWTLQSVYGGHALDTFLLTDLSVRVQKVYAGRPPLPPPPPPKKKSVRWKLSSDGQRSCRRLFFFFFFFFLFSSPSSKNRRQDVERSIDVVP